MRRSFHSALVWLAALGVALPASAAAQREHVVTWTPNELLAAFKVFVRDPAANRWGDFTDYHRVIEYPESYPPASLKVFLDSLEHLAISAEPAPLRAAAANKLTRIGFRPHRDGPDAYAMPGLLPRLKRIYHRSADTNVRTIVITWMVWVPERQELLAFLEDVATKPTRELDFPEAGFRALMSLAGLGDQGREVLIRLHETGAVRDPSTREELKAFAAQDFRLVSPGR